MKSQLNILIEEYIKNNPVFIFNDLFVYLKLNYLLSVKSSSITNVLTELGYRKKHFELTDENGNTTSHPCYYHPDTYEPSLKPIVTKHIKHEEVLEIKFKEIINHLFNIEFDELDVKKDLLDFYMYMSEEGFKMLAFSNKGIKNYLETIQTEFNFNYESFYELAAMFRKHSTKSYIRQNKYRKSSRSSYDKLFYTYEYKEAL